MKLSCPLTLCPRADPAVAAVTNISQAGDSVTITTANGTELTADYVIVTVPLGVLKRGSIGFEPPLSADKQVAIRDMVSPGCIRVNLAQLGPTWPNLAQPGPTRPS
jgi:monoamine oxidase